MGSEVRWLVTGLSVEIAPAILRRTMAAGGGPAPLILIPLLLKLARRSKRIVHRGAKTIDGDWLPAIGETSNSLTHGVKRRPVLDGEQPVLIRILIEFLDHV